MTEKEPLQIVTLRSPAQCILWEHPERIENAFSEILEETETYEDSSHLTRSLHKCRECDQLYFFQWMLRTQSRTITKAGSDATTAPKPTRLATLKMGRTEALAPASMVPRRPGSLW